MRRLLLSLFILMLSAGIGLAQTQCYLPDPNHPGMTIWNPACGRAPSNPWQIAAGKTVSFLNTLGFKGLDNQTIDFSRLGQGAVQLQTAALQPATAFQAAGAGANASTYYPGSLTIGVGANNGGNGGITITAGLSLSTSMGVAFIQASNSNEWMYGTVSSYDITTGAYNVNVTSSNGSGTYSGWQISVSGVPGPTGAAGGSGTPIGGFLLWRTASLPTDFLWASGPAYTPCLSNITYATLYAVVGDADTAANGCIQGTTFGITDMRNVFPMGAGSGYALGTTGGSATHTQVPAEVAYSDVTITSSANQGLAQGTGVSLLNGNGGVWINGGMASIAGYTGYVSPQPMNIMNPYRAMNWIVKYQ